MSRFQPNGIDESFESKMLSKRLPSQEVKYWKSSNVNLSGATSRMTSDNVSSYYLSCYVAGAASSSIRWILNPLELVKTRMQVGRSQGYHSVSAGLRLILDQRGVSGLFQGLGPTALAYVFQTSIKYGTYEILKDVTLPTLLGDEFCAIHRGVLYAAAAAGAEAIADIFMCPWEMLKVKVQTSGMSVGGEKAVIPSTPTILRHMIQHRKLYNFPFGALGPIWMRQIPGTVVNFYTFENTSNLIYDNLLVNKQQRSECSFYTQSCVTLTAGYVAGFFSSVISHPADSLISLRSQSKFQHLTLLQIIDHVGWVRLTTQGLGPRIFVTGNVICFQWLLYNSLKSMMVLH